MENRTRHTTVGSFFAEALTVVGTMIGAGFASGQEIATFFGRWGLLPAIVCAAVLLVLLCTGMFLFLQVGTRCPNTQSLNSFLFGKAAPVFDFAIHFCHFVTLASMFAGMRAAVLLFAPKFVFLLLVVFSVVCLVFGFGAILKVNTFLQPILIVVMLLTCTILLTKNKLVFDFPKSGNTLLPLGASTVLYASSNVLSSTPVLLPLGKNKSQNFWLSFCITFCMILLFVFILLALFCGGLLKTELPLLVGTKSISSVLGTLCAICLVVATFSTLLAAGHALVLFLEKPISNKLTRVLVVVLSALVASQFGFSTIVEYAYPAMGVLGLVLIFALLAKLKKKENR